MMKYLPLFFCLFSCENINIFMAKNNISKNFPNEFHITKIHTNSLEEQTAALNHGIKYAEADLRLNKEGILIGAHDNKMEGDCGFVAEQTLAELKKCKLNYNRNVSTLKDFLNQPFEQYYLDMKDTLSNDEQIIKKAVMSAVTDILNTGKRDSVVLMLYNTTDEVVKYIHENGVRAGMKGYPDTIEQTRHLVLKASENKFELVCVRASSLSPELIKDSAKLGIWHLSWFYLLETPEKIEQSELLVSNGLGGLITSDVNLARTKLAPLWKDIRSIE